MEFILSKLSLFGPFFLLLGVLIFIHEWGHFIVARICGVRVETFSIGFGPKIFQKKWGDTTYRLSLIPLGGYVKMYGDGTEENIPEEQKKESFNDQSLFERTSIVLAGPMMNLIFALFIFIVLGFMGVPEPDTQVGDVDKKSETYELGLRQGDKITKVAGEEVLFQADLSKIISKHKGQSAIDFEVLREGEALNLALPIKVEKNQNPISLEKYQGSIEDVSPFSTSSKVGIAYDSFLAEKGLSGTAHIKKVNGKKIKTLSQLETSIASAPSDQDLNILLEVNKGESVEFVIKSTGEAWSFTSAGFALPELMVGQVRRGSPAEEAGLKMGDQILSINGKKIKEWEPLVEAIKTTPQGEKVNLEIGRRGQLIKMEVVPEQTELLKATGSVEYRPTIGLAPALEYLPPETKERKAGSFGEALVMGFKDCVKWTLVTVKGFQKLITGEVSHKTLSGVISIGKVASDSLSVGWEYFLSIMGIISINLFILNLLPIPVLDGGHLLFYLAEFIKGKPVSLKTRLIGQQIGLVLILTLVVYTIFNDVTRLFFSGW